MKIGHSEEIERILKELEENEGDTIPISEVFLFIPNDSILGLQKSKADYNLRIGKNTHLTGNFDVKGKVFIGDKSVIHGSMHAADDILCSKNVDINGSLITQGDIRLDEEVSVNGDITGRHIYLSKTASVTGTILAEKGTTFITPFDYNAAEDIRRFEEEVELLEDDNG